MSTSIPIDIVCMGVARKSKGTAVCSLPRLASPAEALLCLLGAPLLILPVLRLLPLLRLLRLLQLLRSHDAAMTGFLVGFLQRCADVWRGSYSGCADAIGRHWTPLDVWGRSYTLACGPEALCIEASAII